jgi:hypothetical protein
MIFSLAERTVNEQVVADLNESEMCVERDGRVNTDT